VIDLERAPLAPRRRYLLALVLSLSTIIVSQFTLFPIPIPIPREDDSRIMMIKKRLV